MSYRKLISINSSLIIILVQLEYLKKMHDRVIKTDIVVTVRHYIDIRSSIQKYQVYSNKIHHTLQYISHVIKTHIT